MYIVYCLGQKTLSGVVTFLKKKDGNCDMEKSL